MALDMDAQQLINAMAAAGANRPMSEVGVENLRVWGSAAVPAAEVVPVAAIISEEIAGSYGPIPVRVYRPSGDPDLPALVYIHGGGFVFGSLDSHDALCRKIATGAGCVVISVDYHLAPEHKFPAPLDDCEAALRWVAANSDELGIDGSRISVGGDSAGANLAIGAVRRMAGDPRVQPLRSLLLVYPVTEFGPDAQRDSWAENADGPILTASDCEWLWCQYSSDPKDLSNPDALPVLAKDLAALPATFVLTAEHDVLRDDGEQFADLLRSVGVAAGSKRYAGAFHGFFPMVGILERTDEAVGDANAFLREHFA